MGEISLSEFLITLIFPRKCPVCSDVLPHSTDGIFCADCEGKVTLIEPAGHCKKCGRIPKNLGTCKACAGKVYPFVKNRAVSVYEESMQHMIYKFKYGKHSEYGRSLGEIMAKKYPGFFSEKIDMIIPVPLHRRRLTKRGFNQSELLAKEISVRNGIPVCKKALFRTTDTKPQSALNPTEREKNVACAFRYNRRVDISDKNILLVDDIFTTGSTISACTRLLLANGAANVFSYTLAITE